MKLKDLKKELPYKWRVQSTTQYGANCVAYIDSRDVQDLLDEVCGPEKWQTRFSEHKGNLFCEIGIRINDLWIWKSDCGTESQVEKQKGEASDAFKRAAVMWGIGRFLYSLPIHKIKEVAEKNGKYYPIANGNKIWDITKHINGLGKTSTKPAAKKAPKGNANTIAAIGDAKNALNKCLNLKELKECYLGLDKDIQANAEVIAKKDDQKELLTPETK